MRHAPLTLALLVLGFLAPACRSTEKPLPPGRGLVTYDREPPAGVETFAAPAWKVGDRFVYRKGGLSRLAFRLESIDGGVLRLVDEQAGMVMLYGADLSERGQEKPGEPELSMQHDPYDQVVSWPLWKGKRWSCQFVTRAPDRGDLPLLVTYECDAIEDVVVPAGNFRCLRIWRRARPSVPGNWVERISIAWYAPDAGAFVKRLSDSTLTELEEVDRQ